MEQNVIAAGYDAVYAVMPNAPTLRRLWREYACGADFPDDFYHFSFVTAGDLERIATELRVGEGDLLVDFGSGGGGPLLWMARRTGARAIGIDISAVGVALANKRASALALEANVRFEVGSFSDTAIDTASVNGIMSEDALQYAPDKRAAFVEAARIMQPGGRFVFTAFELDSERASGLPVLGTDVVPDYRPVLEDAGFSVDVYEPIAGWPEPMTSTFNALLGAHDELIGEMGELALNAQEGELVLTLERQPYVRRVFVAATRQ